MIDDMETVSGIRLNIGCGLSPTPGWVNFDNSLSVRLAHRTAISHALLRLGLLGEGSARLSAMAQRGGVRFANASTRIPCASESVGAVYSSHMIEHLDRSEARLFLAEVRRVLRPGGVVRIAAPDLSRLVRDYVATGNADELIAGIHMGLSRPVGLRERAKWTLVGPRHHLWMYDGESLTRLLGESGFKEAAVTAAGTTRIAEPGQLDLREREVESVYVEAIKPL